VEVDTDIHLIRPDREPWRSIRHLRNLRHRHQPEGVFFAQVFHQFGRWLNHEEPLPPFQASGIGPLLAPGVENLVAAAAGGLPEGPLENVRRVDFDDGPGGQRLAHRGGAGAKGAGEGLFPGLNP